MGRAKLPRKSTTVDMTAMCDVAFLLLSFFILATKQKPPEVIKVVTPSSVSTKTIDKNDQVIVSITKEGKIFLAFDDKVKRKEVVKDLNTRFNLQLSDADLAKVDKADIFGAPLAAMKSYLNLDKEAKTEEKLPGIPAIDSTNNQLRDWMASASSVYRGDKMNLLVKGDGLVKYPVFKNVIDAFKKNDLMKFNIITNQENLEPGTELYKEKSKEKKAG